MEKNNASEMNLAQKYEKMIKLTIAENYDVPVEELVIHYQKTIADLYNPKLVHFMLEWDKPNKMGPYFGVTLELGEDGTPVYSEGSPM